MTFKIKLPKGSFIGFAGVLAPAVAVYVFFAFLGGIAPLVGWSFGGAFGVGLCQTLPFLCCHWPGTLRFLYIGSALERW